MGRPYTPFHRFIQWTMRNIPFARKYAVMGDELLGYDKPKLRDKWWLDLEDVEGRLRVSQFSGRRGDHKKK